MPRKPQSHLKPTYSRCRHSNGLRAECCGNLNEARRLIARAAEQGASLVVLPDFSRSWHERSRQVKVREQQVPARSRQHNTHNTQQQTTPHTTNNNNTNKPPPESTT